MTPVTPKPLRFNLFALVKNLEAKKGVPYSWTEVAEASGVNRVTLNRIATNKSKGMDNATIGKLLAFFASQGMPIGINDLYIVDDQAAPQAPPADAGDADVDSEHRTAPPPTRSRRSP